MACSGLHCAGCSGGMAVPPVAFIYAYGLGWVATHLAEVAVTSAVCGAVAVAAVVALMRWQDRRQARFASQASIWTAREVPRQTREPLTDPARPALDPTAVHIHFHGLPDAEQAAVIRHALGRTEP